jgi:hypothetical protein
MIHFRIRMYFSLRLARSSLPNRGSNHPNSHRIRRQLISRPSTRSTQPPNMSLDPPRPLIPFLPPKQCRPKVDLQRVPAAHPDGGEYVELRLRNVQPREGVVHTGPVVCEKKLGGRERQSTADGVTRLDAGEVVVLAAVGVLYKRLVG